MSIKINILQDLASYYRCQLRFDRNLSDEEVIVLWLNYEKQSIKIKNWDVKLSSEFYKYNENIMFFVNNIKNDAEKGVSLSKYTSKRKKKKGFKDSLLLDWGIHHFHLGETVYNNESKRTSAYVTRSKELLYVYPHKNTLYFIAVMNHAQFYDKKLLEIIDKNWSGVIPMSYDDSLSCSELTDKNIKILRERNTNYCLPINGGYTMTPGGGTVGNGISTNASLSASAMINSLRNFEELLKDNEQQVRNIIENYRYCPVEVMDFSLSNLDQERIVPHWVTVEERSTKIHIKLSNDQDKCFINFFIPATSSCLSK